MNHGADVRFGSQADKCGATADVRFTAESGRFASGTEHNDAPNINGRDGATYRGQQPSLPGVVTGHGAPLILDNTFPYGLLQGT